MSKHQPYPARETQILVHGDPDLKVKSKTVGHQLNEVGLRGNLLGSVLADGVVIPRRQRRLFG